MLYIKKFSWVAGSLLVLLSLVAVLAGSVLVRNNQSLQSHAAADQTRPKLVFDIDQGWSNGIVQADQSQTAVTNIIASLKPLQTRYEVDVIINPINKDQTKVDKVLKQLSSQGIPFYLDEYSSDTLSLASHSTFNQAYDASHGLSLSDQQLTRYKTEFGASFVGIRIMEVFGDDFTIRACKTTNPEWCPSYWQLPSDSFFQASLFQHYFDFAQQNNLEVLVSDLHWATFETYDTVQAGYEKQVAALITSHPNLVTMMYANNQPNNVGPTRLSNWQTALDPFKGVKGKGLSDQAWICSDEVTCPVQTILTWAGDALHKNVTTLEFEPAWYFWNLPRGVVSGGSFDTTKYNGLPTTNFSQLENYLLANAPSGTANVMPSSSVQPVISATTSPSPIPSLLPKGSTLPSPKASPTPLPSPSTLPMPTPIPSPTLIVSCNEVCASNRNCQANFVCYTRRCRWALNPGDPSCSRQPPNAKVPPVPSVSPRIQVFQTAPNPTVVPFPTQAPTLSSISATPTSSWFSVLLTKIKSLLK